MLEKINSNLELLKPEIDNIMSFLINNPEENGSEFKNQTFLAEMLTKHGFNVNQNIHSLKGSIIASIGSGSNKNTLIGFYNTTPAGNYYNGHNFYTALSLACALITKNLIENSENNELTLILLCGRKFSQLDSLIESGFFDDGRNIISVMPHTHNFFIENSFAKTSFLVKTEFVKNNAETSSNLIKNLFSFIHSYFKNFDASSKIECDYIDENENPFLNIEVSSNDLADTERISLILKSLIDNYMQIFNYKPEFILSSIPVKKFNSSKNMNRIISHNFKMAGITEPFKEISSKSYTPLGNLNNNSSIFGVNILNDDTKFNTKEFFIATKSDFAKEILYKSIISISVSLFDLFMKPDITSNNFSN